MLQHAEWFLHLRASRARRTVMATIIVVVVATSSASLAACDQSCGRRADSRLSGFDDDRDAQSLVGLTRDEIHARLGTPTSERFSPEWDSTYWIRPQGFCMDGWYLVVEFDEQQVVTRATVLPG